MKRFLPYIILIGILLLTFGFFLFNRKGATFEEEAGMGAVESEMMQPSVIETEALLLRLPVRTTVVRSGFTSIAANFPYVVTDDYSSNVMKDHNWRIDVMRLEAGVIMSEADCTEDKVITLPVDGRQLYWCTDPVSDYYGETMNYLWEPESDAPFWIYGLTESARADVVEVLRNGIQWK